MSRNRKEYIDLLLSDLKLLEERILSVKESDTLPFSFFSASFDRIEKISRSLHELELMQIGEMKAQMEQLVRFLSEQPKHQEQRESIPTEPERPFPEPFEAVVVQEQTLSAEKIILPEYKDPRINETVSPAVDSSDIIQTPPRLLDLKKGISLNDRFLFQRELFNNNRAEMDRVMELLNTLDGFKEAEKYLRDERDWDFEHQTVKEFLLIIKKGFE